MNKSLKFSIVMPTYNRSNFIGLAIESILNQTVSNWELIVVDDASTDNTEEIVKSYCDGRVHYIKIPQNKGVAHARNVGYDEATGEYVVIADSDDINLPNRLERMGHFLDNNIHYDIVVSDVRIINEYGDLGNIVEFRKGNEELRVCWLFQPKLPSFMMFRRQAMINKNKLYHDDGYKAAVDYQWYSQLDRDSLIGIVPEVLYYYRRHSNQISTNGYNIQQQYADEVRVDMLNKLGINPTEMEKKLHSCMSQGAFDYMNVEIFNQCIEWAEKISMCNSKLQVFEGNLLDKVLLEYLIASIESKGWLQERLLISMNESFLATQLTNVLPLFDEKKIRIYLKKSKEKRIYIYGCKLGGYCIGKEMLSVGYDIEGYVDGNPAIWRNEILGKDIISMDNIKDAQDSCFIISVLSSAKESIARKLVETYKVREDNIIFTSELMY